MASDKLNRIFFLIGVMFSINLSTKSYSLCFRFVMHVLMVGLTMSQAA